MSDKLLYRSSINGKISEVDRRPILAKVVQTSGQSIPSGVATKVTFNQELWDINSAFDLPNSKWVAPCNCIVAVSGHVLFVGSATWTATQVAQLKLYVNGSFRSTLAFKEIVVTGNYNLDLAGSVDNLKVLQNDTLELYCEHNRVAGTQLVAGGASQHANRFTIMGVAT